MALTLALTTGCSQAKSAETQAYVADEFQGVESVPGYEILKNIPVSLSENGSNADMTIDAGKVCIKGDAPNLYSFMHVDCNEGIKIGEDYVAYIAPNQDSGGPDGYVKRSIFNDCAKRVDVYLGAPASWEPGKTVTLVPKVKSYIVKLTVKPIVVKDKDAVYVTDANENQPDAETYKKVSTPMLDKVVYEISMYYDDGMSVIYAYDGIQVAANNLDDEGRFADPVRVGFKVDDEGHCFAKVESAQDVPYEPCKEMGAIVGEYPAISFVGWLSPTQMVLDDMVFDVKH